MGAWDSNFFTITAPHANKVNDGIEITAIIINKTELQANTHYNCMLLTDINPSTDEVSYYNSLMCVGTSGNAFVGGLIMPLPENTAALRLYALGNIPANSTMYIQGKLMKNI